jgi:hypothetical protein
MTGLSTVIDIFLKGVIAFSGIAVSYILITFFFPRLIMRPTCDAASISDRGLKKYTYEDGRGVLYEPEIAARKYIKQYLLFTKDGAKYIKCYVGEHVRHVKYDVLVFDNKNKLIDVIAVNEVVRGSSMTKSLALPASTSYVSLILRSADDMYIGSAIKIKFSYISCGIYAVLSAFCIAFTGTLLCSFVRVAFTGTRIRHITTEKAFVSSLIVGLVFGALSALLYMTKYRREIN